MSTSKEVRNLDVLLDSCLASWAVTYILCVGGRHLPSAELSRHVVTVIKQILRNWFMRSSRPVFQHQASTTYSNTSITNEKQLIYYTKSRNWVAPCKKWHPRFYGQSQRVYWIQVYSHHTQDYKWHCPDHLSTLVSRPALPGPLQIPNRTRHRNRQSVEVRLLPDGFVQKTSAARSFVYTL